MERFSTNPQVQQLEPEIITFQVKPRQNVKWEEDVVDNENLNKKKSKICCKYEKPRSHPDEDSSASSCSSSEEDERNEYDRPPKQQRHFHKKKINKQQHS